MSNIDDGGPAFPQPQIIAPNGAIDFPWNGYGMGGISARDWFAGQALQGMLVSTEWRANFGFDKHAMNSAVEVAYRIADAMLSARKSQPQETKPL